MPRSSRAAERTRRRAARAREHAAARTPGRAASTSRDDGSASIEFLVGGLLLLVPIVYLVVLVATVQSAALATEGAARQAARVFVQAPSVEAGEAAAARALELALLDHGVSADSSIAITCRPEPTDCLARRGWVTVSINASVPLPLVPSILEVTAPLAVTIEATATQQVSRFRGAP